MAGADNNIDDLYERNLYLFNDSIVDCPLVGEVTDISKLRDEYKQKKYIEQIDWLSKHGFSCFQRTKGDGDCFYRSFGFAFIERVLRAEGVDRAIEVLKATNSKIEAENFSYQEFYVVLEQLLRKEADFPKSYLKDPTISNSIVFYLRLATVSPALHSLLWRRLTQFQAAQIQLAPEDYAPFFTNQDNRHDLGTLDAKDFCNKFVLPLGKEADHVQIKALCCILQTNVDIAYVDGHEYSEKIVPFVHLRSDLDTNPDPITLLYRPGHYDILVGKLQDE
ncbi:hypothetical protein H0H87_012899 [Tephrocybe sp. NHM501043]|nr:hypothetical protein H0H87_012899 [Tephrocybe sp. NHM501043]